MPFDKNKFSFKELTMNENGKSSGSGFIGVILGLLAIASFGAVMVGYFLKLPETVSVMEEILQIIMAVTVLLGVRKVSGDFREAKLSSSTSTSSNTNTMTQTTTTQSPQTGEGVDSSIG